MKFKFYWFDLEGDNDVVVIAEANTVQEARVIAASQCGLLPSDFDCYEVF